MQDLGLGDKHTPARRIHEVDRDGVGEDPRPQETARGEGDGRVDQRGDDAAVDHAPVLHVIVAHGHAQLRLASAEGDDLDAQPLREGLAGGHALGGVEGDVVGVSHRRSADHMPLASRPNATPPLMVSPSTRPS